MLHADRRRDPIGVRGPEVETAPAAPAAGAARRAAGLDVLLVGLREAVGEGPRVRGGHVPRREGHADRRRPRRAPARRLHLRAPRLRGELGTPGLRLRVLGAAARARLLAEMRLEILLRQLVADERGGEPRRLDELVEIDAA